MSLIEDLISDGYLKTPKVIQAFKKIKREDFVLPETKHQAKENYPLPIGYNQTISQPLTVAFMIELLDVREGQKVLDVGAGSGWVTALLSEIVGTEGRVYAIERLADLKVFGEKNISKYGFIESGITKLVLGDGYKGLPSQAPFDRIHVAAAVEQVPLELIRQLNINGKMVIPEGKNLQDIILIKRVSKSEYKRKHFPGFSFVPLVKD